MRVKLNHINLRSIRAKRTMRHGEPAYNVQEIGTPLNKSDWMGFYFELRGFDDSGVDYFDGVTGRGIQSIGKRKDNGRIIASLLPDLYGHPDFDILWLR